MSTIIATHWIRSEYERCLVAGETRRFGTRRAAEMWARSVIEPVVTTNDCYWRDVGRASSVELTECRASKLGYGFTRGRCRNFTAVAAGTVEAEVIIVPSVGELGWTP